MLDISEAYRLFETLSHPVRVLVDNNESLNLKGVVIWNSIDKSFGRTYFRTNIGFAGNFWIMHEYKYISYRVSESRNKELIDECKAVQAEQHQDALKLKTHIKSLFPDISVQISMMDYDFFKEDRYYLSNIITTGKVVFEIIEPMNDETCKTLERIKEIQTVYQTEYTERIERWNKYWEDEQREEKERLERLSRAMDEHRANQKKNFGATKKRLSRLEQRIQKLNK